MHGCRNTTYLFHTSRRSYKFHARSQIISRRSKFNKKHIDDVRMHLDPIYFLILASDSISLTSSSGISNTANTAPVIQSPDILSVSYVAKSLREDTAFE